MIKNQAEIMAREKNWMTPLHLAAHNNHIPCAGMYISLYYYVTIFIILIEAIIAHLANIDVADRTGKTSLHHACYNGHVEVRILYIYHGYL